MGKCFAIERIVVDGISMETEETVPSGNHHLLLLLFARGRWVAFSHTPDHSFVFEEMSRRTLRRRRRRRYRRRHRQLRLVYELRMEFITRKRVA